MPPSQVLRITVILVFSVGLAAAQGASQPVVDRQLARHFGAFTGCLILHDMDHEQDTLVNPDQCLKRLPPGETFEVFLALAGLESGVVKDAETPLAWDKVRRSVAAWNHDQGLGEALRGGATWFFQRVAEKIGVDPLYVMLTNAPFGNRDLSGGLTSFWLDGGLLVSANEQAVFLEQLYRGQLAFRPEVQQAVKRLLVLDQGENTELSGLPGTVVRDGKARVGWFVGHVRSPAGEYVVVANIEGADFANGRNAQDIATSILKARHILP